MSNVRAEAPLELVQENAKKLVSFQVWPLREDFDVIGWLSNFKDYEQDFANNLLSKFMLYSDKLTNELLKSAFLDISNKITPLATGQSKRVTWARFVNECIISFPTGEDPNPTDSGYMFARKVRQYLGVAEERVLPPPELLELLDQKPSVPVVFVDDFAGSGNQFVTTWNRRYTLSNGKRLSFSDIFGANPSSLVKYVVCVSTDLAKNRIESTCGPVVVHAANVLSDNYSAVSMNSTLWPEKFRVTGPRFVKSASERAGIPDNEGNVNDWRGFGMLGMTFAFAHSTPDAMRRYRYFTGKKMVGFH